MMISNFNIFGANQIFCDLRNDYLSEAFLHHAFILQRPLASKGSPFLNHQMGQIATV